MSASIVGFGATLKRACRASDQDRQLERLRHDGTGTPVTGLQASNFQISDTFGHGGTEVSQAIASFETFKEHQVAKGAYTIGLGGGFVGQMPIIIVDVTHGQDRGRAMTQVRF